VVLALFIALTLPLSGIQSIYHRKRVVNLGKNQKAKVGGQSKKGYGLWAREQTMCASVLKDLLPLFPPIYFLPQMDTDNCMDTRRCFSFDRMWDKAAYPVNPGRLSSAGTPSCSEDGCVDSTARSIASAFAGRK